MRRFVQGGAGQHVKQHHSITHHPSRFVCNRKRSQMKVTLIEQTRQTCVLLDPRIGLREGVHAGRGTAGHGSRAADTVHTVHAVHAVHVHAAPADRSRSHGGADGRHVGQGRRHAPKPA